MEKSTETKGKIHSAAADLLKLIEAELSKVSPPDMIAKLQKLPMEVQVRILLLAALEASGQTQPIYQPVFDSGGLA